jgi:aminopeptidase N
MRVHHSHYAFGTGPTFGPVSGRLSKAILVALLLAAIGTTSYTTGVVGSAPGEDASFDSPPRGFDFLHMRLEVTLTRADMKARRMPGVVTYCLRPRSLAEETEQLRLNAVGLEIQQVELGPEWRVAKHRMDGEHLTIELDHLCAPNEEFTVRVRYVASPRGRGLYFVLPDDDEPWTETAERDIVVYTMSEPLMARYWLPCHDWPDTRWPSDVFITVPKPFAAVSVGEPVGAPVPAQVAPGNDALPAQPDELWTYHWRQLLPIDPHMFGFAVGRFVTVRFDASEPAVLAYVQPGREQAARTTLRRVPQMIDYYSRLTGVAYPWPQYSHVSVPRHFHGGMEHVGFSMISPRSLTEEEAEGGVYRGNVEGNYIAHMLAHQWFGGLVNYRHVKEAWLNECFATYLHQLWRTQADSYEAFLEDMHDMAQRIARGDVVGRGRPMVRDDLEGPGAVYSYDGSKIYWKGAWVLHMLRHQLGDELFWKAVNFYLKQHRGTSVGTSDLQAAFEHLAQRDLKPFFDQWVYRGGVPELDVSYRWDADSGQAVVEAVQKQTVNDEHPAFVFPLDLHFQVGEHRRCETVQVTSQTQTFTFSFDQPPTVFCVDPDCGLLKRLEQTKPHELWVAQIRQGPTALSRSLAVTHVRESGQKSPLAQLGAVVADRQEYWALREQAARALTGEHDATVLECLLKAEQSGIQHPHLLRAVIRALAQFPTSSEAHAAMLRCAQHEHASARLAALRALSKFASDVRTPETIQVLALAARLDGERRVREAALRSLAEVGDEALLPMLRTLVESEQDDSVRQAATAAITAIEQRALQASP